MRDRSCGAQLGPLSERLRREISRARSVVKTAYFERHPASQPATYNAALNAR